MIIFLFYKYLFQSTGAICAGYWLAHRAVKTVIDHIDQYEPCDLDVKVTKDIIWKYFEVQ